MGILIQIKTWFLAHPLVLHISLLLFFAIVIQIFSSKVFNHIFSTTVKKKYLWLQAVVIAVRKPMVVVIWYLTFVYLLILVSTFFDVTSVSFTLNKAMSLGITIICIWFLLRLIKNVEINMRQMGNGKSTFDETTIDGIIRISKIALFIVAILSVLQSFGVPLAAIYTAAGGAGIGITLAAQDMLKNFFGGLMLYFDRPFSIGDWISSPDKNIEGTVEKIGWRTTKIRTFDKRPLYVPNSTFLNVSVENPSRMQHRRIKTDIGVRYSDFKQIAVITQQIEEMLRADEDIATNQTIWVNLVNFADSALEFRIYAFTKTSEWVPFQKIQQKIFLKILDIIEQNNAEAAFPSRTLYVPDAVKLQQPKDQ